MCRQRSCPSFLSRNGFFYQVSLFIKECDCSGHLATCGVSLGFSVRYESSRIVEKPVKHLLARVARGTAPCLGYGAVPHFSLFLRRRRRRKRKKSISGPIR